MVQQNYSIDKETIVLIVVMLPIMLIISLSVWIVRNTLPIADFYSDSGLWNLTAVDFDKTAVRFSGLVEYIPGALLTPEEFEAREGEAVITQTIGMESRYGTSRITLYVPEGSNYIISESSPLTADRIYINDKWTEDLGIPGTDAESTEEGVAFFYYMVQPKEGVIEIVQQVSNFEFRSTVGHSGYVIGTPEMMRSFIARDYMTTGSLMGCYAALALIHIVLWLLFRRFRANLYCALFAVCWFFWAAATGPNVVIALFPDIPWELSLRLEYLCLAIATPLLLLVVDAIFPKVVQKVAFFLFGGTSAIFFAAILAMDTLALSTVVRIFEAVLLVGIVYLVIRLCMVIRNPDFSQVLVVFGAAVFMYAAVRDILYYNHIYIFPYGAYSNDNFSGVALLVFTFMLLAAMLLITFKEIRESREKEEELAAKNALLEHSNQLRKDIMSTISHETKTPLAVLSGYAELVAMELRASGRDEQYIADLNTISTEARNVAKLMQGLQDIASMKDVGAEKSEVDFSEIIHKTARLYEHVLERRNTRLVIDLPEDLPSVYGNAVGLTRALFNLLSNAAKHTESGEVTITAHVLNAYLEVTVADTGTGVTREFLPHAFESRSHDDPDGTGLGLSLCREIITIHGGEITMSSEPGEGTTLRFTLQIYGGGLDNDEHSVVGGRQ